MSKVIACLNVASVAWVGVACACLYTSDPIGSWIGYGAASGLALYCKGLSCMFVWGKKVDTEWCGE